MTPAIVADSAPHVVITDFHATFTVASSTQQSDRSKIATCSRKVINYRLLRSCHRIKQTFSLNLTFSAAYASILTVVAVVGSYSSTSATSKQSIFSSSAVKVVQPYGNITTSIGESRSECSRSYGYKGKQCTFLGASQKFIHTLFSNVLMN